MSAIRIDFTTLVLSLATLYFAQAAIFVVLFAAHRKYRPTPYWAQGAIATAIGAASFVLRGQVTEVYSVVLSNAFLLGGTILPTCGLAIACGRRPPWRAAFLLWSLTMATVLWFYFVAPSFPVRVALYHMALFAVLAFELFVLVAPGTPTDAPARWMVASGTFLCLLTGAFRGSSALMPGDAFAYANNLFVWSALVRGFTQTAGSTMLIGAHYRGELERLSRLDPLTGLMNRRAFDDIADRLWAQAKRQAWPMAFMMIDIDHFKTVNDRFGHACGDDVLRGVGELLSKGLREDDLVGRLGGEEFAVVLPNTDAEHAVMLAERIRSACSGLKLPDGSSITLSAGIAEGDEDDHEWHPVLRMADHALYRAKALGRDRVEANALPRDLNASG